MIIKLFKYVVISVVGIFGIVFIVNLVSINRIISESKKEESVSVISTPKNYVDSVDIKGIYLGMSSDEFSKKIGKPAAVNEMSIAGVQGSATVDFEGEALQMFHFSFDSRDFNSILQAIKIKYPQTLCEEESLMNAMGAKFQQVECFLDDKLGNLYLKRYVGGDITRSVIQLMTKSLLDKREKERKAKSGDI